MRLYLAVSVFSNVIVGKQRGWMLLRASLDLRNGGEPENF